MENTNHDQSQQSSESSSNRGFAAMDQNRAREIQSQGGKAVSQDRQHMADIGRRGGEHSRGDTSHRGQSSNQENNESNRGFAAMSKEERTAIASKGGQARGKSKSNS